MRSSGNERFACVYLSFCLGRKSTDLKIGHYKGKRVSVLRNPPRLAPERSLAEVTRTYTTLEVFVAGMGGTDV